MKKYFAIAIALTMVCACGKEIVEATPDQADSGVTLFSGGFAETKISLGDKDGSVWKALWEDGDALTVKVGGETKGTATLVSGVGSNLGTFSYPGTIADGTDVELIYEEQAIDAEQSKASTDRSFKTSATANARVEAGSATFTMTHNSAVVRVNVASEELSGATLNAVILRCEGANLNANDGDYVRVSLTDTPALSTTAKEIVFSVKEYDCTGKEIDIAFELTKDEESFTLPVGFTGKAIAANKVNSFVLGTLSEAYCVGWYEPHDTRLMVHPTYAYGEANTFFIQCKSGSTYNGATYTPNSSIPSSVAVSIKARGDFTKVVNPIGSEFEWAKNSSGTVYTMRMTGYVGTDKVNPRDNFTFSYDGSTTVTVSTKGAAYAGAPILLMKKGGKTLWAFNFWNIAADGTTVEEVSIDGYKFLNMDIGQATTQYATWKAAASNNPVYRTVNKYQWGRFVPTFWETGWSIDNAATSETGNVPTKYGPITLEEELTNPLGIVQNSTLNVAISSWCSDNITSAWGGCAATTGTKAVMDPCPKGYRVPDKEALQAIKNSSFSTESTTGYPGINVSGSLFLSSGVIQASRTTEHYLNIGGAGASGSPGQAIYWSNYNGGPGTNTSYGIQLAYSSSAFKINEINAGNRAIAASVRCQKDTDNR